MSLDSDTNTCVCEELFDYVPAEIWGVHYCEPHCGENSWPYEGESDCECSDYDLYDNGYYFGYDFTTADGQECWLLCDDDY